MRRTPKEMREDLAPWRIALRTMVRRVAVKATGKFWQLVGYPGETFPDIPLFPGIGVYARPRAGKGEAIVLRVGATDHRVIVATRDREIQLDLDEDETAIFNSTSRVIIKKNGEVHVDNGSGAQALATKADLDALESWIAAHTHTGVTTGGGTSGAPSSTPPSGSGTTVLKGK